MTTVANKATPERSAPSPYITLRHLFLTLFLRGHSSQGLQTHSLPSSMGQKLALTLLVYALIGIMAVAFIGAPVFVLAAYLHAMTFTFLGLFLASSTGAILFNKEEADILLHRPITPNALLVTKVVVLLEASFWIAGAFNLAGFVIGFCAKDGGWRFVLAHALSIALEAAFCAGCIVLAYQLCLRWCGRERLESVIVTAQVGATLVTVVGSQILPQLVIHDNKILDISKQSWWLALVPPAWFASFDDFVSGHLEWRTGLLAAVAVLATAIVLWIAFDRLAQTYETGIQRLTENVSNPSRVRSRQRWIERVADSAPLRWWLHDPVARASFLLTSAYLLRDRDVKLRVYPSMAPMIVMPAMMLFQQRSRSEEVMSVFGILFAGVFLSLVTMMGLSTLKYSQQWQASAIFRVAPMAGPEQLCHGARRAVFCWLALPTLVIFIVVVCVFERSFAHLYFILPGLIAMPVFSLIPNVRGDCVPLSAPVEDAKGASAGYFMLGAMFVAMIIAGIALWSWATEWYHWYLLGESAIAFLIYTALRRWMTHMRWQSLE